MYININWFHTKWFSNDTDYKSNINNCNDQIIPPFFNQLLLFSLIIDFFP